MTSATHALAVGHFYEWSETYQQGAVILETADGGVTWSRHNLPITQEGSVRLFNLSLIEGLGSQGLFAVQTGYNGPPYCPAYVDHAWPCEDVVVQSDDGGSTWARVERLSSIWTSHLSVPQDAGQRGMLLGDDAGLYTRLPLQSDAWAAPSVVPSVTGWSGLDMATGWRGWATGKTGFLDGSAGVLWQTDVAGST